MMVIHRNDKFTSSSLISHVIIMVYGVEVIFMVLYQCDKCGAIETSPGAMTDVQISHAGKSCVTYPRGGKYQVCKRCEQEILTELNNTEDVQPVKHGVWISHDTCSNCKKSLEDLFEGEFYYDCEEFHFCPNCGAKMDIGHR